MAEITTRELGLLFKPGSKEFLIATDILAGMSREDVIRRYFPWVGKREPFIYRENIGKGRQQKDLNSQRRIFLSTVSSTIKELSKAGWNNPETLTDAKKWTAKDRVWVRFRQTFINHLAQEFSENPSTDDIPSPGSVTPVNKDGQPIVSQPQYKQEDLAEMLGLLEAEGEDIFLWSDGGEDEVDDFGIEYDGDGNDVAEWKREDGTGKLTRKKVSNKKGKFEDQFSALIAENTNGHKPVKAPPPPTRAELIDEFYNRMMIARDFVISRELGGAYLDFISTRALKDGAKAIAFGLHPDEVMGAVTKTWNQDSINEMKRHERLWKPKEAQVNLSKYPVPLAGAHQYLGYAVILAEARIPIFLVGPSGSGKSFMARDLADYLEADYGEIPLTAGATPSWLTGAETISGYKSRPFVEIYAEGGVFCFEEMDAADPNMLLLVNNALANESFTNPVTGQEVEKSRNFIAVATANTWGLGANRQYTGRERLDAATLDRWRVGRIEIDYDQNVEKIIIKQMKKLADKKSKVQK